MVPILRRLELPTDITGVDISPITDVIRSQHRWHTLEVEVTGEVACSWLEALLRSELALLTLNGTSCFQQVKQLDLELRDVCRSRDQIHIPVACIFPNLSRLDFCASMMKDVLNLDIFLAQLLPRQLTYLKLYDALNTESPVLHSILSLLPFVSNVDVEISSSFQSHPSRLPSIGVHRHLRQLRVFDTSNFDGELDSFDCPSLERLDIAYSPFYTRRSTISFDSIRTWARRSQWSLGELTLSVIKRFPDIDNALFELLADLSTLRTLHLCICSCSGSFLDSLRLSDVPVLPRLQELRVIADITGEAERGRFTIAFDSFVQDPRRDSASSGWRDVNGQTYAHLGEGVLHLR
jgi:hypothetical protein